MQEKRAEASSAGAGVADPSAAEPAAAPGPLAGEQVRVVSESASRRWFGLEGKVVHHHVGSERVQVEGLELIRPVWLPAASVESIASLQRLPPAKTLRQLQDLTKRSWLLSRGFVRETMEVELQAMTGRLAGTASVEIGKDEILLYWKLTAWRLDALQEKVVLVDPLLVFLWREALKESEDPAEEFSEESRTLAFHRLALLQKHWQVAELLLVPIWSGRHWTLLALWKKELEGGRYSVDVEYVDTLPKASERCKILAEQVLQALDDDRLKGFDLQKTNCAQQGELECGFAVAWYCQEFLRAFLGAGRGSTGWLAPGEVRKEMHALLKALKLNANKLARDWKDAEDRLRADLQRKAAEALLLQEEARKQEVLEALQVLSQDLLGEGMPDGALLPPPAEPPADAAEAGAQRDAAEEGAAEEGAAEENAAAEMWYGFLVKPWAIDLFRAGKTWEIRLAPWGKDTARRPRETVGILQTGLEPGAPQLLWGLATWVRCEPLQVDAFHEHFLQHRIDWQFIPEDYELDHVYAWKLENVRPLLRPVEVPVRKGTVKFRKMWDIRQPGPEELEPPAEAPGELLPALAPAPPPEVAPPQAPEELPPAQAPAQAPEELEPPAQAPEELLPALAPAPPPELPPAQAPAPRAPRLPAAAAFPDPTLSEEFTKWARVAFTSLPAADQLRVDAVRHSHPIAGCGRCAWTTGCLACDWRKTARHLRAAQLGGVRVEGYQFRFQTAGESLLGELPSASAEAAGEKQVNVIYL